MNGKQEKNLISRVIRTQTIRNDVSNVNAKCFRYTETLLTRIN